MARQRGELVPIGEAFSGMGGPVQAIRDATPQALHHFTQADQVNQLVSASEADPEIGFMARMMALCSLPRTNPGNRKEYKRVNGPLTLIMLSSSKTKLPYGNLPRLLLAWVCTEAVQTQSRELVLGSSLSEFMRKLGMAPLGGGSRGERTRLRNQIDRLFNANVRLTYEDEHGKQFIASNIADRGELWWDSKRPNERVLWESKIYLGEAFFHEIINHPVPLDMNTLKALKRCSLGLDLYLWLAYRTFSLKRPAAAHLEAVVPPVRCGPLKGRQPRHRSILSPQGSARVEEDQACLGGPELRHGSGSPDPLALDTGNRTVIAASRTSQLTAR